MGGGGGYNHITNYRTGPWVGVGERGGNYTYITNYRAGPWVGGRELQSHNELQDGSMGGGSEEGITIT